MIRIRLIEANGREIQSRIGAVTRAEMDADCQASGYEIIVAVHPAFGMEATLRLGGHDIGLGEAEIEFDDPFAPGCRMAVSGAT